MRVSPWVRLWVSVAACVPLCVSGRARAEAPSTPSRAAPAEYHPKLGLVVSGALVFGLAYLPALKWGVGGANSPACSYDKWMTVPLAGPFVTASQYGNRNGPPHCEDSDDVLRPLALIDGVAQVTGAALLAAGLLLPLAPDKLSARSKLRARSVAWRLAPVTLGKSGAAVFVVGAF